MDRNGNYTCCAVIVAAGSGSRMGNMPVTKQFLSLGREPVIFRTLRQFEKSRLVSSVVLVAREEEIPMYSETVSGFSKPIRIAAGGASRTESVKNGIIAGGEADFVAIHDGARCLITPSAIDTVIRAAFEFGAASAGCRAVDTLKTVDANGEILATPDRSLLWHAQTPQVSRLAVYKEAASRAENIRVTDDNSLLEAIGVRIRMVDCGPTNIKITTPEDLCIGEALLKLRGAESYE